MRKSLLLLISICTLCLLNGCGGGGTPPPPPIISLSPSTAQALDVNQSVPITANVTNGPSNQGFDWALTCGGGNCGTITAHTASGAPATYTAPSAPLSPPVTITAKLTGLANFGTTTVTVTAPPTVTTAGTLLAATLASPYSLQLAANGGAGTLSWALGGGTSLPDTLSLSGTGMITGTPSGASGTFNFKVHVTDSGNPQLTSPDVQLSIAVAAPPISVTLSPSSAFVALNGSTKFIATLTNDQPNGNVDWTLTLNGMACPVAGCGSVSPLTTTSGVPTTYTAPASVPPANITLTATTVDRTPPASANATVTVTAHGFTATGNMETARELHTATLLGNGKVLLVGGNDSTGKALASVALFDPTSGTFAPTGSMETARANHTATLLNGGKVLVIGGTDSTGQSLMTAELFDPATGTFAPTKGGMETARANHTATLLKDGTVLVTGGVGSKNELATAELFDPATGTFAPTGSMETTRAFHTATLLNGGKVLVIGGTDSNGQPLMTAELFVPTSGTFAPTGSMTTARAWHTATLLVVGKVLIAGGNSATAELFAPISGTFSLAGSMETVRFKHTATLQNDGTVLIAGGDIVVRVNFDTRALLSLATAELFDPASEAFTPTGSLETARFGHTATLLNDGRALVTGGRDETVQNGKFTYTVLSSAELYQ
jgi:hypothetical protein